MGSRTSVIWLLAMCGLVSSEPYTPGTPGAEWSEMQIQVTGHKVLELIDVNNHEKLYVQTPWDDQIPIPLWDECCDSNPDYNGDRAAQRAPTENKLLRLAFHDCFKYTDGTGGCDGCIGQCLSVVLCYGASPQPFWLKPFWPNVENAFAW